jgi:putative transposase
VTSRGNEKTPVFKTDKDRQNFLNTLQRVNKRHNWICHACCLMTNHYPLLMETPEGNLSIGMRQVNGVYTQLFNKIHGRTGHLFQGRYKAILIQKDSHLLEACRYVVLNPVRAKMVEKLEDYPWSSYLATAGRTTPHPCLTIHWVLGQVNGKRGKAGQEYRTFVSWGIGKPTISTGVCVQAILGEEAFADRFVDHLRKQKDIPEITRNQKYLKRPALERLFPEDVLRNKGRRDRRIAAAAGKYGYLQREITAHLGLNYATISRLVATQEENK